VSTDLPGKGVQPLPSDHVQPLPSDHVQPLPSEGVQPLGGEGAYESSASLRLAPGPLVGPVVCRVVSMILTRADCPMDRLEDAMAVCDALSAHGPARIDSGHLALAVSVRGRALELRVGGLTESAASRLVQDAVLPGVGNVLERMTDELRVEPAADGSGEELVMGLAF
jgi:hypothetical protein